jgi:NodT family efflux transporter outer membrane factor (OMF) lipoprotein
MKKILLTSCCFLALSACSMSPDYQRPEVQTPATYENIVQAQNDINFGAEWWHNFGSTTLNGLINAALAKNTDIAAGVQRIEQARAALKIAGADLLPQASGSGGMTKTRRNPERGASGTTTNLQAGVNVNYELDLFGANRAGVAASKAGYESSVYDQRALELSLMAEVANGYFTLVNLRERKKIAAYNLDIAREVLRITEARVKEGASSEIELSRQKNLVASNEAALISLDNQINSARTALAVLLGQPPQGFDVEGDDIDTLVVPDIAAGQPSDLLLRRPDLLSAEEDLKAANANIGAARAAFFPSISFSLSDSISLASFGEPSSTVFSLASSIAAPIFRGGALQGGLEQATARQLELAQNYRGNVLTAFKEVEDALSAVRTSKAREDLLAISAQEASRAYELSQIRYDQGAIDFESLLDTQNSQLSAQDNYAQAKLDRLSAATNLYKALGGGWITEE